MQVRPLSRAEHLAHVESLPSASFLQCPAWGEVKTDWSAESLGWVDSEDRVRGAALVLYRRIPRTPWALAYVPEGPLLEWESGDLAEWLQPFVAHLTRRRAFSIKIGPPVVVRRWKAETVKEGLRGAREGRCRRLADLPPDSVDAAAPKVAAQLTDLGWRQGPDTGGFADYQPRYIFQLPLTDRTAEEIFAGFNQQWRRNVRKAEQAGVEVDPGDPGDLPAFHALYVETAQRDRFASRPLRYFQQMYAALSAEHPDRIRLYLARHQGTVHAATLMVRVGDHAWYSYGASSTAGRNLRPSNAIQWRMICDARALGAQLYDLRGMSDSLDPDDPLVGLLQFKIGTGGEAVECLGEWDLPVNRVLHTAFQLYLRRR
ncbi:peptidoglycan bridge formation glycyltransferase FemY [soil metagenome]